MNGPVPLTLALLRDAYSVCRLDARAELPDWARPTAPLADEFQTVTRTRDELSAVCRSNLVPAGLRTRSDGWRCLRVDGVLDLALSGVLLRLLQPLADARCPVFTVATYDTDYLLVRETDLPRALGALRAAGHVVHD
jgi:hypothetical protein